MGLRVDKVIADKMVMVTEEDVPVEIMQTEETRIEKSTPPERIWDPGIEIVVVPRRWIIGDNWRTFLIVVVVYFGRVGLSLIFSILTRAAGYNRQTEFSGNPLECFQDVVLFHWQFVGVSCGYYGIL
jgi:hypothetical protein